MTTDSASSLAERSAPHSPSLADGDACASYNVDGARLARAQERALPREAEAEVAETFKALAHPTRVRILHALRHDEMCVCELAALLELSMSATSRQLAALRERGAVDHRQEGRFVYYRLADPLFGPLLDLGVARANGDRAGP